MIAYYDILKFKNTKKYPCTYLTRAHSVKNFDGTSNFGRVWDAEQTLGLPQLKKKDPGQSWEKWQTLKVNSANYP